ncbi:unnamed protein product [Cuscuta epithymum]|uniref:Uncharacterized protein n=1 Tax=Cuscuta epithymum TaxID=186058 RepID=A0AAV0E111_9ASTE|nr:unnamed protein product [Cuscuta epithymum]
MVVEEWIHVVFKDSLVKEKAEKVRNISHSDPKDDKKAPRCIPKELDKSSRLLPTTGSVKCLNKDESKGSSSSKVEPLQTQIQDESDLNEIFVMNRLMFASI